jgi:hypothetical protein
MPVTQTLLDRVKEYVRAGEGDDLLLLSLISAAKQYLSNAGVPEPPAEEEAVALYELAVVLFVNMIYNGGKETWLDKAMTAIILQIKQYNEEGTA